MWKMGGGRAREKKLSLLKGIDVKNKVKLVPSPRVYAVCVTFDISISRHDGCGFSLKKENFFIFPTWFLFATFPAQQKKSEREWVRKKIKV